MEWLQKLPIDILSFVSGGDDGIEICFRLLSEYAETWRGRC